VVRLIRSKGVGVYFVTQNPLDIPETVLGQLGNRVQHALRAFTPRDQKAVKTAAETLRANPTFERREPLSPSWASARRWSRFSMSMVAPLSSSVPSSCHRVRVSGR
jgi:DNA helicase HerA-like ATPase